MSETALDHAQVRVFAPIIFSAAFALGAGPFRVTRNPMYVSMVLVYAGLAAMLRTTWVFAFLVPAVIAIQMGVIKPEERYLESEFGAAYANYRSRVRRWI